MATFVDAPEQFARLDYRLLQNGAVILYRQEMVLAQDLSELRRLGYVIDEMKAGAWLGAVEMHVEIAGRLHFPSWYGSNLNALRDCLSDLPITEDGGRAVVFHHFDQFAARNADLAWNIADILEESSRHQLLFGRRLMALLQVADGSFSLRPVGARAVMWNPREWLQTSRDA